MSYKTITGNDYEIIFNQQNWMAKLDILEIYFMFTLDND